MGLEIFLTQGTPFCPPPKKHVCVTLGLWFFFGLFFQTDVWTGRQIGGGGGARGAVLEGIALWLLEKTPHMQWEWYALFSGVGGADGGVGVRTFPGGGLTDPPPG